MLRVVGKVDEGTQSLTSQFNLMVENLRRDLKPLRQRSTVDPARGLFSIDLTQYGAPLDAPASEEGE